VEILFNMIKDNYILTEEYFGGDGKFTNRIRDILIDGLKYYGRNRIAV